MTLTTSARQMDRRLCIVGILLDRETRPGDEFLYIQDDVNRDTPNKCVETSPSLPMLQAPWTDVRLKTYKPKTEEGWHLLARNTTQLDRRFLGMIYYNELDSRPRIFLYNSNIDPTATGFRAELSLLDADNMPIRGALFPVRGDPDRRDTVVLTLPEWPAGTWTMVEAPLLYPMIESPQQDHYISLYEEPSRPGKTTTWFRIRIIPYEIEQMTGTLLGDAVGTAMATITIGEQHQNSQVRIRVGDELMVRLPGIPGTGYSWIVVQKNTSVLADIGEPRFEKRSEDRKFGAPEDQVFHFRVTSGGVSKLQLEYRRPWDKRGKTSKVFSVTLVAQE